MAHVRDWSWNDVRRDPIKRALAGLAFALVIGFVPAAYYTYGVSGGEVRADPRAPGRALAAVGHAVGARRSSTASNGAVARVRRRGMIGSAVLWVLVSGLAAPASFGWCSGRA